MTHTEFWRPPGAGTRKPPRNRDRRAHHDVRRGAARGAVAARSAARDEHGSAGVRRGADARRVRHRRVPDRGRRTGVDDGGGGGVSPRRVRRRARPHESGRARAEAGRGAAGAAGAGLGDGAGAEYLARAGGCLDARAGERPLAGARVAVQEYGVSNLELLDALRARGAQVTAVPVYQWTLPEDLQPLHDAVTAVTRGEVDVADPHVGRAARAPVPDCRADGSRTGPAARAATQPSSPRSARPPPKRSRVAASAADLEASHPKMGVLVREAAERGGDSFGREARPVTEVGPS